MQRFRLPAWSLEELAVWARHHCLHELIPVVLCPGGFEFPESFEAFAASWKAVDETLGPHERRTLARALSAAVLAKLESIPAWVPGVLEMHIPMETLGFPLSWAECLRGRWNAIPLAMVNGGEARLVWAMMGLLERAISGTRRPHWWEAMADAEARDGVARALRLLEARFAGSFFFWPVLPEVRHPVIFGRSLTLPVFIAGWALANGKNRRSIVCTGDILEDGSLGPVGFLEEKARLARDMGFSAILRPKSEKRVQGFGERLAILEVESLDHACFTWELHGTGTAKDLDHHFHCLGAPRRLASNVHLLDRSVILWEGFDRLYRSTLVDVLASKNLADQFAASLESVMDDPALPRDCLDRLMDPIDPGAVRGVAHQHPPTALRLAQLQLTLANHRGRIEEGELWVRLSEELAPAASRYGEGLRLKADHLNRAFIHQRHNRYDFRPELPEDLEETLKDLVCLHAIKNRSCPGSVTPELGKLYGTVAQNFGFCGPPCLDELRRWTHMAQGAFGDGALAEYREDWRRQLCYLLYGLMDAGVMDEAREVLSLYLGMDLEKMGESDMRGLGPFCHAAVARFLAETGSEAPAYVEWMCRHLEDRPGRHPWELWLLNAGLCLEDPRKRALAWTRSVLTCLEMGPTARAMGLMPLAFLWWEKLKPLSWIRDKAAMILEELEGEFGGRPHFQRLIRCLDWEEALDTVLRNRERLFPFTYR